MLNNWKLRLAAVLLAVSTACSGLVLTYEGEVLKAYKDPVGIPTIGVGHTGKEVKMGQTITKEKSRKLLMEDLSKAHTGLEKYVKVELSQGESDAYTSFIFNVGITKFKNSTLLKKLNRRDYEGACKELKKWVYAGGKKLPGLVKRREAEYKMCMEG